MNYLLDVNVLVAWGWADHIEHRRAASWIQSIKKKRRQPKKRSSDESGNHSF